MCRPFRIRLLRFQQFFLFLSVSLSNLLSLQEITFDYNLFLSLFSYFTQDKYVLWSLVFQCLMVVQNAVAVVFYKHDMSDIFDYICMGGLGGFVLIGNAAFIIAGIVKVRCFNLLCFLLIFDLVTCIQKFTSIFRHFLLQYAVIINIHPK